MKKRVLGVIFFTLVFGFPSFAFEGSDLLTYPRAFPVESLSINLGIGINAPAEGNMAIPPLLASVDYGLPIGGLPFSVGGIFGFYGSEWRGGDPSSYTQSWRYMSFGGRLGYHFNWGIDKLDTYALATMGWTVYAYEKKIIGEQKLAAKDSYGYFLWGLSVGGRYFLSPNIGAFLELGYSSLSFASLGISFKL
jgi:hypothetical protein